MINTLCRDTCMGQQVQLPLFFLYRLYQYRYSSSAKSSMAVATSGWGYWWSIFKDVMIVLVPVGLFIVWDLGGGRGPLVGE